MVGGHRVEPGFDGAGIVFAGDAGVGFFVAQDPGFAFGDDVVAELARGEGVAPIFEGTFGELHDVAFVDEGEAAAFFAQGVFDCAADEALGAVFADGLDAEAGGIGEADFGGFFGEGFLDECEELGGFGGSLFEFDAGVDVFAVFAEDHHVAVLGALDGAGDAFEPADGAQADVEIENLAEGDVEAADAAAGGGGEGAFDADEVVAEGVESFVGEPVAGFVEGFFAGEDFVPVDFLLAVGGFRDGGVDDADGCTPDVGAGAVAFDEGDDGVARDGEAGGGHGDFAGHGGSKKTGR